MKKYVLFLLFSSFFVFLSCATKTRVEYRDRVVDHYITKTIHDTLREKTSDSVFVSIIQRGDTVFNTKYVEKTKWRDRIVLKTDTFMRDSVQTQIIETTVEKKTIPHWCYYSLIFCIFFIIISLYKIFR